MTCARVNIPLVLLLLALTSLQFPTPSNAENVYLYRLKKLQNNFHSQIEETLAINEDAIETTYLSTLRQLVDLMSNAQNTVRDALSGSSPQCGDLPVYADVLLNTCAAEAAQELSTAAAYILGNGEKYQAWPSEFSLKFMGYYLTDPDWQGIFGEDHYNYVYNKLSEHVLIWDNVDSVELYSYRQEGIRRLQRISATLEECTSRATEDVTAELQKC